ncbi:hypothetical protein ACPA9J_01280 [Pseudomonas aeruginosa]
MPATCPRYLGRVIHPRRPEPARPVGGWSERLRRSDIHRHRPGGRRHQLRDDRTGPAVACFDLAEINGGVRVRMAEDGRLVLLDGRKSPLRADTW